MTRAKNTQPRKVVPFSSPPIPKEWLDCGNDCFLRARKDDEFLCMKCAKRGLKELSGVHEVSRGREQPPCTCPDPEAPGEHGKDCPRFKDSPDKKCRTCSGSGLIVEDSAARSKCPTCNGTGGTFRWDLQKHEDCYPCNGTGVACTCLKGKRREKDGSVTPMVLPEPDCPVHGSTDGH